MGNKFFIKGEKVCVKSISTMIEAILRLKPPPMPKECRSFAGVFNYLYLFCPEIQKTLKPIYDLTRKQEQQ